MVEFIQDIWKFFASYISINRSYEPDPLISDSLQTVQSEIVRCHQIILTLLSTSISSTSIFSLSTYYLATKKYRIF